MAARLRSADTLLAPAVRDTVAALDDKDLKRHAAVIRLAGRYAAAIDEQPALLGELGPKLLAALVEMGATPKAAGARAPAAGGGGLAKLRATRAG